MPWRPLCSSCCEPHVFNSPIFVHNRYYCRAVTDCSAKKYFTMAIYIYYASWGYFLWPAGYLGEVICIATSKMKHIRSVLWAANAFKLRSSDHPQAFRTFSTLPNFGIQGKTESKIYSNQHSIFGMNVCSTCNFGRRCFIHSGSPKEAEMGNNSRPMDFVRGLMEDNTRGVPSGAPLSSYHIEQDADIVHIKVLRNNAFVTVTDSKGNKKFGATAGKLTGKGGKVARYAAESTAEHIGREARDRGLRSVVMKVNGFTYFKKKKQAILSFREGYTRSRGDKNPVVFIEDTTRKPHNGCRLPKKRRI